MLHRNTLLCIPFLVIVAHAEEPAVLTLQGLRHEFSEKESRALQKLLEKNTTPPDEEGRNLESKPYGHIKVAGITYEILHGDIRLSNRVQFVKLPDNIEKNFRSIFEDNKLRDENRHALIALILKDWITDPPAK